MRKVLKTRLQEDEKGTGLFQQDRAGVGDSTEPSSYYSFPCLCCCQRGRDSVICFASGTEPGGAFPHCYCIYLNFFFYIRAQLINRVLIVSGGQQRDSVIHVYARIPSPSNFLPSRLPQNIEQSALCYTVGLCWLPILNSSSQTVNLESVCVKDLFNA